MKSIKNQDMTIGNPLPILLTFALPLLISNLFQQLYNMVDTMVVGQFVGANALAAVGSVGYITNIFLALNTGLVSGVGIIVSQHFGAKNDFMIRKSIATSLYLMTGIAVFMSTLGFLLAPAILRLIHTPEAIFQDSLTYLRISCIGIFASTAYNAVSAILKATGDSRTPLFFLILSGFLNLILDLVFVIVLHQEVAGVAVATILAQVFSAFTCALYATKRTPYFRISKTEWKFDKALASQCLRLGVPLALQSSMISVSNLALQRVVNGFGETVVAALTAANRYESLIHQPLSSLNIALSTFAGQNIGAGKPERIRKSFRTGILLAGGFVLLLMPVSVFLGSPIIRLFTSDMDVVSIGAAGIRVSAMFYLPLGMIYVTRGIINGSGDATFSLLTGIVELVTRVCLAAPITSIPFVGFRGIWLTTGLTWLFAAILGLIRYRQLYKH